MTAINKIKNLLGASGQRFHNASYGSLTVNYENFFQLNDRPLDFEAPLLQQVQRVSFELSNTCNYSRWHKKCPASKVAGDKTLPGALVHKALTELSSVDYSGVVAFHRYNEPLMDPRLFSLIRLTRELCPKAKVLILSNGFYLTQQMADDLCQLGIWVLAVSAYSKSEYRRLVQLEVGVPYLVFESVLDDREDIYSSRPLDLQKGCLAPLRDLTINVDGKVNLCCLDWQNRHNFGDLSRRSLSEIISAAEFTEVAKALSRSVRNLDICRRCSMSR